VLYLEYIKKAFQQRFAYRVNFFLTTIANLLMVFIQVNVWQALFQTNRTVNGIMLTDMINFVILNLFINSLSNTDIGTTMGNRINSGEIVNDFIKPINLKLYFISEDFGGKLFQVIFTIIPTCIIASYIWGFSLPDFDFRFLIFLITVLNGVIIMYNLNYILGMLAFWLKNSWYVNWYLGAVTKLFGGTLVPLWFYPDFLYKISIYLPFRLIAFEPINIYLKKISIQESISILYLQFFWILTLFIIERFIWIKAQKKITIFGG